MPPKRRTYKRPRARSERTEQRSANSMEDANRYKVWKPLGEALTRAYRSLSSHTAQKRRVFRLLTTKPETAAELLVLLVPTLCLHPIKPEERRRLGQFLRDLFESWQHEEDTEDGVEHNDVVAFQTLQAVLKLLTAREPEVRLSAMTLSVPLLKCLDMSVDRFTEYAEIVQRVRERTFDLNASVREQAVAALAVFQTGMKRDDVSQQLVCVSCEDPSPAVRVQTAANALATHIYYIPLVRLSRDVSPSVRRAAWDALGRFRFADLLDAARHYESHLPLEQTLVPTMAHGASDPSPVVSHTARTTLGLWLQRDCGNDPTALLSHITPTLSTLELVCELAVHLDDAHQRFLRHAASGGSPRRTDGTTNDNNTPARQVASPTRTVFPLNRSALSPSNLLMWHASCRAITSASLSSSNSIAVSSESDVLIPLGDLCSVISDVIEAFIRGEDGAVYQGKTSVILNTSHAPFMLTLLLRSFGAYEECGYFAHVDDTTRGILLRQLRQLLRIVVEDDPKLHVREVMIAVGALIRARALEAGEMVHRALESLYQVLHLPKVASEERLSIDNVESFRLADTARREKLQQALHERKQGSSLNEVVSDEELEELRRQVGEDTLYLRRMMEIVVGFLSRLSPGESIPQFCLQVVQLGQAQCDPQARATAVSAIGLHCLLRHEAVATFMPELLRELSEGGKRASRRAALLATTDLLLTYGAAQLFPSDTNMTSISSPHPSAQPLLDAFLKCLFARDIELRCATLIGHTKLLFAQSYPGETISLLALLLISQQAIVPSSLGVSAVEHVVDPRRLVTHTTNILTFFFSTFASSHPDRMRSLLSAGLTALSALLHWMHHSQDSPSPDLIANFLRRLTLLTDAAYLRSVCELDSVFASKMERERRHHLGEPVDQHQDEDDGTNAAATSTIQRMRKAEALAKQSSQIALALATHSLHEELLKALLVQLIAVSHSHADGTCVLSTTAAAGLRWKLVDAMKRLRLYGRTTRKPLMEELTVVGQWALDALEYATNTDGSGSTAAAERTRTTLARIVADAAGRSTDETPNISLTLSDRDALIEEHTGFPLIQQLTENAEKLFAVWRRLG